tara:strand:- start:441 stop:1490 length:1050 start_codon:yes stop_codon:yes gene_type:complete
MAKKRNHYIPKFLLKNFSSRKSGDKSWVWLFHDDNDPVEPSVTDVGLAKFFYGNPENGIENELSVIEGKQSALVKEILQSTDPNLVKEQLADFVWLLAVRTSNMRNIFADNIEEGIGKITESSSEASVKQALRQYVYKMSDDQLFKMIQKFGALGQSLVDVLRITPGSIMQLREWLVEELGKANISCELNKIIDTMFLDRSMAELIQNAHVEAMEKMLLDRPIPERFAEAEWSLVRSSENNVILGDGIVIARSENGEFGHPIKYSKDWVELWIPISSNTVLIARQPGQSGKLPKIEEINNQSASLSRRSIFSSESTDQVLELSQLIATGTPALSSSDIDEIVGNIWEDI